MTIYQARFICYQYNCGGQHTNGFKKCSENFNSLEEMYSFAENLIKLIECKNSSEFASKYVVDGYVEKIEGLYKIQETKLNSWTF